MSEDDGHGQEENEAAAPSLEPPEPVLSAVSANREDQIQNAVTFLSHPKAIILTSLIHLDRRVTLVSR